ncbi:MAG TPA: bifunctional phosphoribosyl-AMP cyclohydrolase/phosphoribosyl-ATP diphosphatase HisIE [Hellea balneolensis]|uniref:Histidine biosynthesis bifunctional protein HisIE n=1 Tax=Hellea balneolensis TaxID=287478 RepID=A0A7V5U1C5_9PROT|nr:bifunctional phosphoribosyl-AMP cyclohydrolase/phosphoribosyl-ATP diphosphatase HisIE [Hellea balneolensis]
MKIDFDKGDGLVPAIIQDADTLQVLMLGYMNKDALRATRDSGFVTFWSRSRQCLWQKGETSGNRLKLESLNVDCDGDTLLIKARPAGPTCHTGTISCFGPEGPEGAGVLAALGRVIEVRRTANPEGSYTAKLLQGPLTKAAQKVGEEGVETVIAALAESNERLACEAADLLYHLLVLLAARNMSLSDVIVELQRRRH